MAGRSNIPQEQRGFQGSVGGLVYSAGILEHFEEWIEYHGMIQGIIHSLYKEVQPPYFDIRDLTTGQLIKCVFSLKKYDQVVKLLKKKDAVVLVSGEIAVRRSDRKIKQINVDRMESAATLTDRQFKQFFGCAPKLTGKLSTKEFIEQIRADGE